MADRTRDTEWEYYEGRCPNCGSTSLLYSCAMTHGYWDCAGCGVRIDSRVASPIYDEEIPDTGGTK